MKSNLKLIELNEKMGLKEYEMFQEIPAKETGATNLCHGIPFENFSAYLESQMARKYQNISKFDTPTIVYIMYESDLPIGYVGIRTKIDSNWKNWSGNIFYCVRPSKRHQGYGTKMLKLAIEKCSALGISPIYLQANKNNIFSIKIIEKCNGKRYKETDSFYYEI